MDYGVGDVIRYRTFGGVERVVKVVARCEDIKNGYPGFDAVMVTEGIDSGMEVWGYDDQIVGMF